MLKQLKKIKMAILGFSVIWLTGCQMTISPEDVAVVDEHMGNVSDIPIEVSIPEEVLNRVEQGYYIDAPVLSYPYENAVEVFSGLSPEICQQYTEEASWPEEDGSLGWGKTLSYENMIYSVGNSGLDFAFYTEPTVVSRYRLLLMHGVPSALAYSELRLNEQFPCQELSDMSIADALEQCQIYVDTLGISYQDMRVCTLSEEVLKRIEQEYGIMSPDEDSWKKEDECYIFIYQRKIDEYTIYDLLCESSLILYYSPTKGLLNVEVGRLYGDELTKTEVNLITPAQVVQNVSGMAAKENISGTLLKVTDIELGYVARFADIDFTNRKQRLLPCYRIRYVLTRENGTEAEGSFLANAVTGYYMSWDEQ